MYNSGSNVPAVESRKVRHTPGLDFDHIKLKSKLKSENVKVHHMQLTTDTDSQPGFGFHIGLP
jgi:hypothetical protein